MEINITLIRFLNQSEAFGSTNLFVYCLQEKLNIPLHYWHDTWYINSGQNPMLQVEISAQASLPLSKSKG